MSDFLAIGDNGLWTILSGVLVVCALFGFAPRFVLRLITRCWPKGHPRRAELMAELAVIEYFKRPVWVFEQLETALLDGLPARRRDAHVRREMEVTLEYALLGLVHSRAREFGQDMSMVENVAIDLERRKILFTYGCTRVSPEAIGWHIEFKGESLVAAQGCCNVFEFELPKGSNPA